MTSDTTPEGFTSSTDMKDMSYSPSTAYYGFDNNSDTKCYTNNCNLGTTSTITFSKEIIIEEMTVAIQGNHDISEVGTENLTWGIYGVTATGTETLLVERTKSTWVYSEDEVITISDSTPYVGLKITKTDSYGAGYFYIYKCQVTK